MRIFRVDVQGSSHTDRDLHNSTWIHLRGAESDEVALHAGGVVRILGKLVFVLARVSWCLHHIRRLGSKYSPFLCKCHHGINYSHLILNMYSVHTTCSCACHWVLGGAVGQDSKGRPTACLGDLPYPTVSCLASQVGRNCTRMAGNIMK